MFFEEHAKLLSDFARVSQAAGARADYVQGGGGNTSAKLAGGLMGIKASGYCLSDITPETAYAVLDYEALRRFYYGNESEQLADVEKQGSAFARENTKQIDVAEEACKIAEENLDLNTFSYKEGKLPILDVLSAQLSWIQSYSSLIQTWYQQKVSLAQYNKAVGIRRLQ